MSQRVPQLTDTVILELVLPSTTEEWADDALVETGHDVVRDADYKLIVSTEIGGNTNAVSCARNFLDDIEWALRDVQVDPMSFGLEVTSKPGRDA